MSVAGRPAGSAYAILIRSIAALTLSILTAAPGSLEAKQQLSQAAATRPAPFPSGRIVEQVVSRANPAQQYAVYLPSSYRTDRTWPLLVLMDPRGRALIPLQRVQEVADRLGYMVISSYNSRSDEYLDHNADAINAMLDDADRILALDPHRVYLVGQSGTARGSWIFAQQLRGNVAGVIGIGASLPQGFQLSRRGDGEHPAMVFFGAAGTDDYNFDEMWRLDSTLDSVNLPHRITFFDGPHSWPPAATLTEAVEWMELQAMAFGLKPADPVWLKSIMAREMSQAGAMAAAGDWYHAWRRYRSIVSDFRGLLNVTQARALQKEMEQRHDVRRIQKRLADIVRQQEAYAQRLGNFLGDFRQSTPPALEQSLERLQLDQLERRAGNGADSVDAHAAERSLEHVWVYTSFYEPRAYLDKGDATRALAILEIAETLRPDHPEVCYYQAKALSQLGRNSDALRAIECAARGGIASEQLEQDPVLSALVAEPAIRYTLGRLHAESQSYYWPQ